MFIDGTQLPRRMTLHSCFTAANCRALDAGLIINLAVPKSPRHKHMGKYVQVEKYHSFPLSECTVSAQVTSDFPVLVVATCCRESTYVSSYMIIKDHDGRRSQCSWFTGTLLGMIMPPLESCRSILSPQRQFFKCQDQSRSKGVRATKGLAPSRGDGGVGEGRWVFTAALPKPCLPDSALETPALAEVCYGVSGGYW